jgi:hypothetical protein
MTASGGGGIGGGSGGEVGWRRRVRRRRGVDGDGGADDAARVAMTREVQMGKSARW